MSDIGADPMDVAADAYIRGAIHDPRACGRAAHPDDGHIDTGQHDASVVGTRRLRAFLCHPPRPHFGDPHAQRDTQKCTHFAAPDGQRRR